MIRPATLTSIMGTRHSSTSCAPPPNPEDVPNATVSPTAANPNAVAPSVPRGPMGTSMPQLMRPETFEEKLYRKVSPLAFRSHCRRSP